MLSLACCIFSFSRHDFIQMKLVLQLGFTNVLTHFAIYRGMNVFLLLVIPLYFQVLSRLIVRKEVCLNFQLIHHQSRNQSLRAYIQQYGPITQNHICIITADKCGSQNILRQLINCSSFVHSYQPLTLMSCLIYVRKFLITQLILHYS